MKDNFISVEEDTCSYILYSDTYKLKQYNSLRQTKQEHSEHIYVYTWSVETIKQRSNFGAPQGNPN